MSQGMGWGSGVDDEGYKRKLKLKEREERRNNIVIRRLEGAEGEIREKVGKLMKKIGVEVGIEWVRNVRGKERVEGEMVVVRPGNREQKMQVMEKKTGLRGTAIKIEDDLTWGKRRIKLRIGEISQEKRRKDDRKWGWDEEKGRLKNWKGKIKGGEKERNSREGRRERDRWKGEGVER